MIKQCLECDVAIYNESKQSDNQKYCTPKCRKTANRKKKSKQTRLEQKRSNLIQNDEIVYLLRQCRRAKTVQILHGHNLNSFLETMDLVRNRPKGDVRLCHIAPVKGENSIGLFHCLNLFYGGTYQNRKFGKRYFSGGLSIPKEKIVNKWLVKDGMSNNDILIMIEKYLMDIIPKYLELAPVRKSKKVQIVKKITDLDQSKEFDELIQYSYKKLTADLAKISRTQPPVLNISNESKYIVYMDSLTRFISYGGERVVILKKLRKLMVIAYMALERTWQSTTYNKYFYVKYELLIDHKYGQARLKNSDEWPEFKDLIYKTAFDVLQGRSLDIKKFRKIVMSYFKFPEKSKDR